MDSKEVAAAIGTDPKRLRRFLRADNTYRNAGQGGRYVFTDRDMPTLKKRFAAWESKASAAKVGAVADKPARRRKGKDEVPAMPENIAIVPAAKLTTKQREERDRLSRERVDRLEERLRAAGLHVSQSAR
jgi:hypothetical protein